MHTIECQFCRELFNSLKERYDHLTKSHRRDCPVCGENYSAGGIYTHRNRLSQPCGAIVLAKEAAHILNGVYLCKQCQQRFTDLIDLANHKIQELNMPEIEQLKWAADLHLKFTCKDCGNTHIVSPHIQKAALDRFETLLCLPCIEKRDKSRALQRQKAQAESILASFFEPGATTVARTASRIALNELLVKIQS